MGKIPLRVIALLVAGHKFGINCIFHFKTFFYSHYTSNTQLLLELWKIKSKQKIHNNTKILQPTINECIFFNKNQDDSVYRVLFFST